MDEQPGEDCPYKDAIKALNSLQYSAVGSENAKKMFGASNPEEFKKFYDFLDRAGISLDDLDNLSIIHVSGTKGKSCTCAFTESLLRHHGHKTGFVSSPHLTEARERIMINGSPLSKKEFARYFWEVYNRFIQTKEAHDGKMPGYPVFFLIFAFHVLLQEKPDVVVLEAQERGEFDLSNVVRKTDLCAVTPLAVDLVTKDGGLIEKVAWDHSGIFKSKAIALTGPQQVAASSVLRERAIERKVTLHVVPEFEQYETMLIPDSKVISLGIPGKIQRQNAALALQLSRIWLRLRQRDHSDDFELDKLKAYVLSDADLQGLRDTHCYGRNQVIQGDGVTYFLDSAESLEGIEQCCEWFSETSQKEASGASATHGLLFTITGKRTSDPEVLLQQLRKLNFKRIAFSPATYFRTNDMKETSDQFALVRSEAGIRRRIQQLKDTWHKLSDNDTSTDVRDFESIAEALHWLTQGRDSEARLRCENISQSGCDVPEGVDAVKVPHVLITGSLYLVGGALTVLKFDTCQ